MTKKAKIAFGILLAVHLADRAAALALTRDYEKQIAQLKNEREASVHLIGFLSRFTPEPVMDKLMTEMQFATIVNHLK